MERHLRDKISSMSVTSEVSVSFVDGVNFSPAILATVSCQLCRSLPPPSLTEEYILVFNKDGRFILSGALAHDRNLQNRQFRLPNQDLGRMIFCFSLSVLKVICCTSGIHSSLISRADRQWSKAQGTNLT